MPSVSLGPEQQQPISFVGWVSAVQKSENPPASGVLQHQGHHHLHSVPSPQTEPKYTFSCLSPYLLGGGAELTEWMGSVIPTPPKIGTPSFQSRELWVCGYGLSYRLFVPRDSSLGELSWRDIIV